MEHEWSFVRLSNTKGRFGKPAKLFRCLQCHRKFWSIPGALTDPIHNEYVLPDASDGYPCLAKVMPSYGTLPLVLPGTDLLF